MNTFQTFLINEYLTYNLEPQKYFVDHSQNTLEDL